MQEKGILLVREPLNLPPSPPKIQFLTAEHIYLVELLCVDQMENFAIVIQ